AAKGHTFDEARRILRRHYQWIVINDFLPRVCDPGIVNGIVFGGNRFFRPDPDDLFMPFEFSVAAYRFGHSMVRAVYHYNSNFPRATLGDLFSLTALSGDLGASRPKPRSQARAANTVLSGDFRTPATLPESWIIDWNNFVDGGANRARPIDTDLSRALFNLTEFNKPMPIEARLSVRNLLRGYMLRLPTGQAVARALGFSAMTPAEIEDI